MAAGRGVPTHCTRRTFSTLRRSTAHGARSMSSSLTHRATTHPRGFHTSAGPHSYAWLHSYARPHSRGYPCSSAYSTAAADRPAKLPVALVLQRRTPMVTVHQGCVHSTTTRPEASQEQDGHSRVRAYTKTETETLHVVKTGHSESAMHFSRSNMYKTGYARVRPRTA